MFIDFDNIEIGVKTTLNREFDVGAVLEAVKERGEVITKVAYGDWKRAGDYSRMLTQHAVRMVQRNMTPGGDKNGADINLALDALEMAFTHDHINAFVIVGGDSDFISLVEKLKQYDRKVFVVGGRAVHQPGDAEELPRVHRLREPHPAAEPPAAVAQGRERGGSQSARAPAPLATTPVSKAFPLVTRALRLLTDREVTPQLGPAEEHAAAARLDVLRARLRRVELPRLRREAGRGGPRHAAQRGPQRAGRAEGGCRRRAGERGGPAAGRRGRERRRPPPSSAAMPEADAGAEPRGEAPQTSIVDGIRLLQRVLATPGAIARWPMYIRNVKQAMRAADPGFDERKHGNLVEILRSVQRDGLVRLDRDRQGVLRVFQGPQLRLPVASPHETADDAAQTDEQGRVETAVLRAPAGAADFELAAERSAPAESAAAEAAHAEAPVTGEPEAEAPAAEVAPRRRRKAGTAAPRTKTTTARKPRARAATPRRKKTTETE